MSGLGAVYALFSLNFDAVSLAISCHDGFISSFPVSLFLKYVGRISCCGTLGSVASWECWDAELIPSPAQWVKDAVLLHLWLGHSCGWDLISGPGTPCAEEQPKKKKIKENTYMRVCVCKSQLCSGNYHKPNNPKLSGA